MLKIETNEACDGVTFRELRSDELAAVSGGLTIATYPVKAIPIFGMTAYVSNGELVGVRLSDGTIKTP